MPDYKARKRIGELAARSLLTRDEDGRVQLHDVQRMYVQGRIESLPALHAKLVDAYAGACQGRGFAAGPDDGYFFQFLPYHLACSGRMDALAALLLDHAWLQAKLRRAGPAELVADYAFLDPGHAAHGEAMLVGDAVSLASHVLEEHRDQLSSQLVGRLLGFEGEQARLGRLLGQIRSDTRQTWLCPLTPSFTAPGGPLVRTFVGHTDVVRAVALLPDGKRALSASDDRTLKLWDLSSGSVIRTLQGHSREVRAVTVLPDGKRALSASDDRTLKLWNLDTSQVIATFVGDHSMWACAVAPNARLILAGDAGSHVHILRLIEPAGLTADTRAGQRR